MRRTAMVASLLLLSLTAPARSSELAALRHQVALRFFEPEPHMELARHYHERGQRLQAFYILEHARRSLLERPVFDTAFRTTFLDSEPFDNSAEAEGRLLARVRSFPEDPESLVRLADVYISRSDWEAAKPYLLQAIELDPTDFSKTAALAEIYNRQGKSEEAEKVIRAFLAEYHDSIDAHRSRVAEALARSDDQEGPSARELIERGLGSYPDDGELLFNLAVVLQREGDDAAAGQAFARAAEASPRSAHIQGWSGRFFLKVLQDSERALDYYLSAYFLDPHFYDSEYAESRVREVSWELGGLRLAATTAPGETASRFLGSDNPRVVGFALEALSSDWDEPATDQVFDLLGHDDVSIRWGAMELLRDRAPDAVRARLDGLLTDPDLRRRGLGAYLAMRLGSQQQKDLVESFLSSEAQLLRYDAISALLMDGGREGHARVLSRRTLETHPALAALLERVPDDYEAMQQDR